MLTPQREHRLRLRWTVLVPVAVAHVWTMTWLAWELVPATLRNPNLVPEATGWGLGGSLSWVTLAAVGVVVGGASLAAVPARMREHIGRRAVVGGCRGAVGLATGGLAALIAGLIAAAMLGAASALLATAAGLGLVFYRVAGRFFPAVAVVGTGLWHALVLAIPDPGLSFAWPAVLVLTHVTTLAVVKRVYGIERPGLTPRAGWGVALGWAFLALLLTGGMTARGTTMLPVTEPTGEWMWLWPAVALTVFVVVAAVVLGLARSPAARHQAARWVAMVGTWWLIVYNAAWLLGAGLWWGGAAVLMLGAGGVAATMWWHLSQQPQGEPGYRLP